MSYSLELTLPLSGCLEVHRRDQLPMTPSNPEVFQLLDHTND